MDPNAPSVAIDTAVREIVKVISRAECPSVVLEK